MTLVASGLLAQVSIVDTIRVPQGGLFNGRVEVSMPPGCSLAWNGQTFARWQSNYTVTSGAFTASLIPTTAASPAGCYYVARFVPTVVFGQPQIASYTETWVVPDIPGPLLVKDLRATVQPSPSAVVNPAQVSTEGSTVGDCIIRTSGGVSWGPCGSGAATETLSFSGAVSSAALTWTIPASTHGLGTEFLSVELLDGSGNLIEANTITIDTSGNVTVTWATPQAGAYLIVRDRKSYSINLSSASSAAMMIESHQIASVRRVVCKNGSNQIFETSPVLTQRATQVGAAIMSSVDILWSFPSPATGKCYAMGE